MSSAAARDAAESRRAGKEPVQEPEWKPQREWVALVSAAIVPSNEDDERAQKIGGADSLMLDLDDPPRPSYLVLHPRVAPNPRRNDGPLSAYILAADRSGCFLVQVVEGNRPDFFLCHTRSRTVTILPKAGPYMRPHLSIGLIADPHHPGHYVLAQLHHDRPLTRLLCYSTASTKRRWCIRGLDMQQDHDMGGSPFYETGVLAHDGRLWWLALAYGVFYCDPCTPLTEAPTLRFLPLPDDCEVLGGAGTLPPRIRTLIDQRRCVRPSEGKLRFVEILGLSYNELAPAANPIFWMWTLDDLEGEDPWTLEYEVAFAEIWDNETYRAKGLPPREVPHVALVDPTNHFVVYFFQGSKLFGWDAREKKVVACEQCPVDRDQVLFPSSRPIVDAWVPPPPPPPATLPGDDAPPTLLGDDDDSSLDGTVWSKSCAEQKKRELIESVDVWLDKARLEWTRDTDTSFENWRSWKMAPPQPDEPGGQADDEPEIQLPPTP